MFLWTACVTPFSQGGDNVDYESLRRLLVIQAEAKNGVVLLGSTGEGWSLTDSEKRELVEFACSLKLNTRIIVGVPGVNLHHALEWIDFCKDMPIHGYLMTTPIYTKPGIIGQTLWFEKLLEKVHAPAMLYNIPSRAGINLHTETVRNLSGHDKFWAIKDSSGTIDTLIEYKKVAPNIEVFCGDDEMMPAMAAAGAVGLVSVASNLWPHEVHKYAKKCLSSESPATSAWLKACKALFTASNPIPTKALLHDIGLIEHKTVRIPLSAQDLPSLDELREANQIILNCSNGGL
ncbi:4-hydroxy-tetrahydrodipicolinate synthase [Wolbachia endosymbiont of Folsomia candida]|uniref:4-hydroxy-tetrahydrodipicolinate synthase n=1 Tax=Wolbachia endosymbiont of Folsomia candida TaxID=169402 RepID=UPI000A6B9FC6|nr:4-hydroxy-tetrahydrodipicolinate synthase [Wolbachia endosymbiont of Folsomia candida]APR99173.2 4-hydroxy-tetrahydrodipicolinate synthase [Wolbachia endosymbiont of Folsomia candida]